MGSSIDAVRGVNYVPSNAVNATQMWLDFDAAMIDRELGLAEALGLNSLRVFVQYLVYEDDPAGLLDRFAAFLKLAHRHGLSVMPVLFDDCWLPEPVLGEQAPEPRPGRHNPYWQSSPGRRRLTAAHRPALRRYVEDFVGRFDRDPRVIAWDLYNEPQSRDDSVALVRDVFGWARRIGPSQPLTVCWYGSLLSDITSIHFYVSPTRRPEAAARLLEAAKSYGNPVVATEALGRPNHGELQEVLPFFAEHGIGWYVWELMIGADQTRYQWPGTPPVEEDIVFQGLLYPDGTPYRAAEAELIRAQAAQVLVGHPTGGRGDSPPDPCAMLASMSYHVVRGDELDYEERPFVEGQPPRRTADLTTAAELKQSRGRMWRYPPHTRGRRHADGVQEEVFVVVSGTLTMLLGDPPERVDLPPLSVVAVEPKTALQVRNETDEELVLYIYGAPAEQAPAEMLEDPGEL